MVLRSTGHREETTSSIRLAATKKSGESRDTNRATWRHRQTHQRPLQFNSVIPRMIVRTGEYLMHQPKSHVLCLGILMVIAIGLLDDLTGPDISLSLFYLLPIIFVTWRIGRAAGFGLSFLSVCVWVCADAKQIYSLAAVGFWNAAINLAFFLILSATLAEFSVLVEWVRTDYLTGLANARGFHDMVIK